MLTPGVVEALRSALVDIYPTHADTARIVADAGIDPARVAYDAKPVNYWNNVLLEAQWLGKLPALTEVALREYGENPPLVAAVSLWKAEAEAKPASVNPAAPLTAASLDPVVLTLLADEARRGRLTVFVGPELAQALTGLPPLREVAGRLASRYGIADGRAASFYALAQQTAGRFRNDLLLYLREQLGSVFVPGDFDRTLAHLSVKLIVTTRYDGLIEDAFQAARRSLDVLTDDFSAGQRRSDHASLVKLYGDLRQPRSLALTEDDIDDLFAGSTDKRALVALAEQAFAGGAVLAFGVDAGDPGLSRLVRSAARKLGDGAPVVYVVRGRESGEEDGSAGRRNVEVIDANPLDVLHALAERLA